jgi:threonine dehydratase
VDFYGVRHAWSQAQTNLMFARLPAALVVPADMALPVTHDDIAAAAERIAPFTVRTPAFVAAGLSAMTGANVFVKLETRQRTSSFKDRGAANRLVQLTPRERERGVIAMSAGNHAQAVAYQATRLGVASTIVMPENTPFTKVRRTQQFGAQIVLHGHALAGAAIRALELADEFGLTLVPPYDDARIVAGQGTVGLEFLADVPELDVIVVPIGGGGLIAGLAVVAKFLKPSIEIVGVQTELYPSFYQIVNGLPPVHGGQTIAEGIAVKSIGDIPLAIARELVDDVVLVSEQSLERALHLYVEEEKLVVEGAGAAPLAALLDDPERFRGRNVGLTACGGNIDTGMLANVIARVRLREGRVVKMRVQIDDRPGMLADVARLIGECGANILEVTHQRLFHDVPSKNAELDITFETRAPSDVERIADKLHDAHYLTSVLESTAKPAL